MQSDDAVTYLEVGILSTGGKQKYFFYRAEKISAKKLNFPYFAVGIYAENCSQCPIEICLLICHNKDYLPQKFLTLQTFFSDPHSIRR